MKTAVVVPNYNSAALVTRCATAMLAQTIGVGHTLEVIVVDDGSTDGSADALAQEFGGRIRLIRLPENRGRSTGRNAGAAASNADLLIFVDSDCIPVDAHFVAAHIRCVEAGADVSFGEVCTPGDGFWDRLQRDASAWRLRRFEAGETWTFTTQNVAVRKELFDRCGGFDPVFDRHGFEDRDLFVRLGEAGARVRHAADAAVLHEDRIGLASVSRKLGEAGYHAAHLFDAKHPAVYRDMAFSRLDGRIRPRLAILDVLLWPLASRLAVGSGSWLEWRWLPFRLRALAARGIYGLSFLHGTLRRRAALAAGKN